MRRGPRKTARRMAVAAVAVTTAALVVFHAALFWRRIVEGSIAEPGVLGRWIVGTLMVAGLVALRRSRMWRDHSRRGSLIFWLLVALLHVLIPADESLLPSLDPGIALAAAPALVLLFALGASAAVLARVLSRIPALSTEPRAGSALAAASRSPPLL